MPKQISKRWLAEHGKPVIPDNAPIRIMQFGEGNFLRAFADWIFKRLNDSGRFSGTVRVVQPIAKGLVDKLRAQDYVYTLLLRGIDGGKVVEEPSFIDVIRDGVNPYAEWPRFLAAACEPDLRFVVSNTTEAGIAYAATPKPGASCPDSFPAKVAAMLAARHEALGGTPESGLVFLPCELIEKNGVKLREAVLRHLADWGMADGAGKWVESACLFYNTLVDRIVTGYPRDEAEAIGERLDCHDELLDVGEYFHLWVLEGDPGLGKEIPFEDSGLDVILTDNLKPYRDRKVRVLNGAHTANVLAAHLAGLDTVGEMMADPQFGAFLRAMVLEEILPGVQLPDAEKNSYAQAVFERFQNPFIRHELLSIALNSVSKWKVRVLPSLKDYMAKNGGLPGKLAFSLAGLIAFYRGTWNGDEYVGTREKGSYSIRDDKPVLDAFHAAWTGHAGDMPALARRLLGDASLWDEDLAAILGLTDAVAAYLEKIVAGGIRKAMQ